MKSLLIMILASTTLLAAPCLSHAQGNGPGHGGHPELMKQNAADRVRVTREVRRMLEAAREDFRTWAKDVLAKDADEVRGVSGATIVKLIDLVLKGDIMIDPTRDDLIIQQVPKLAINYPQAHLIRVNVPLWDHYTQPALRKAILVHELVPFRRQSYDLLEIERYQYSAQYYRAITDRYSATSSAGQATEFVGGTEFPEIYVVHSEYYDRQRDGLTLGEVYRQCERVRSILASQFTFMICKPLRKEWQEAVVDRVNRHTTRIEITDREAYGFLVLGVRVTKNTRMEVVTSMRLPALKGDRPARWPDESSALEDCYEALAFMRKAGDVPPWASCRVAPSDDFLFYYDVIAPRFKGRP